MEENSDSSAPNSPEVTRLSGEQAEERTAREGRVIRDAAEAISESHVLYNEDEADVFARILATHFGPMMAECSRLASRVEELEKCLREVATEVHLCCCGGETHANCPKNKAHNFLVCKLCKAESLGMTDQIPHKAECLLAGEHAEEK